MSTSPNEAVLAECEYLLRRALDLIDGHQMSRVLSARLAHLIHDLGVDCMRQPQDHEPRTKTETLI